MSLESTIRADFVSKVEALLPTVTVSRWDGEEEAFNDAKAWPAIYVCTMFVSHDPLGEIGMSDAHTMAYLLYPEVLIFAAAKDDDVLGYGEDQCATMLETLRRGIMRKQVSDIGYAELYAGFPQGRCQTLISARMGQFLYGQSWRVEAFEETTI